MAEVYIFYSSAILASLGCAALVLSVLFRRKTRVLNGLSAGVTASVFSRTYAVFNPYPDQKKVIHRFVTGLPLVVGAITGAVTLLVWEMFLSGLFLCLILIIIGVNMIVLEETPEVYLNTRVFIRAAQGGAEWAPGDLRVLQLTKKIAVKLAKYYFVLGVFLIACSVVLPHAAVPVFQGFLRFLEFLFELSQPAGFLAWLVVGIPLAAGYVSLFVSLSEIKNKLFECKPE